MERFNRREFIRLGIGAAAAALLLKNPYRLIAGSRDDDWKMPDQGRISYVSGEVFLNDRLVVEGALVSKGDVVRTGPRSEAEIEIRDSAVFSVRENTTVEVGDVLASPTLRVRKGWFLIIVRKGVPFKVFTPTVLAGVRGTVFFFEVSGDDSTYLCNCNGRLELFDVEKGELLRTFSSRYHTALDIEREGGTVSMEKALMHYHEDEDILRMAGRFPRETVVFKEKG